ncbi:MAG: YifB family Mg chelatase-like AAA ATPase [Sterolibacteriaceae bacterium]|nr:YifB family Mg chelatase-like AAA ATPase [Sterolibacteriaceae bacterium]MBK9086778.1 YifB family Mg chelatase-like AAA ATPase [Sterolibacteriaceae bacterium]
MSLAVLRSRALAGMDAPEVTVEVHLANGLPTFTLVGLPDTEVKEARDRVRAAIQTSRLEFPARRITVNLAPADLPKESGRFDLPIALGLLIASGQLDAQGLDGYEFAGELSLTGDLRPIRGALAMTWRASSEGRTLILPAASADEAALVRAATVLPAGSLLEVVAHLAGHTPMARHAMPTAAVQVCYPDLADVKGQAQAKRALEVAAAGAHSLLMVGPPGTGKSMLAQRFPGLLPPMSDDEAMEAAALQSIAGTFRAERFRQRAYRAPHHTSSTAALVGGGSDPRPGEISLSHHGVLFLDELPEFERRTLEALREPLETGHVSIARATRRVDFPARFQLVAAMNPCPCGYLGSAKCRCTPDQVARYRSKVSGPLLDRIDMTLDVPALSAAELQGAADGESSASVQTRVIAARSRQIDRQGKSNAMLATREIDRWCAPDEAAGKLLSAALVRLKLSARAYHRVLKLARTVADLAASERIASAHIAEAIHYRRNLGDN